MERDPAQRAFERCGTLAEALQTGFALRPPWQVVDVVVQDEFTHDVVMQATPDGPAVVLVCT
jgi:hypothetical protein